MYHDLRCTSLYVFICTSKGNLYSEDCKLDIVTVYVVAYLFVLLMYPGPKHMPAQLTYSTYMLYHVISDFTSPDHVFATYDSTPHHILYHSCCIMVQSVIIHARTIIHHSHPVGSCAHLLYHKSMHLPKLLQAKHIDLVEFGHLVLSCGHHLVGRVSCIGMITTEWLCRVHKVCHNHMKQP